MGTELEQALEIIAQQAEEIERLKQENKLLRHRVDQLVRYIHGSKSEKLSSAQLELFQQDQGDADDEAQQPEPPAPAAPKKPRKRKKKEERLRKSIEDLPTTTEELIPEEVLNNPDAYQRIDRDEVTVELHYEPASYRRHLIIRPQYVLKDADDEKSPMLIAKLPKRLLAKSVLTPSLLAGVITGKYCWHLPLYRQELMMCAAGIECSRANLCNWMQHGASRLEKLYELLKKKLLAAGYLQADETPMQYIAPGCGKTKQGYLWVLSNPELGVYFEWHTGRGYEHLLELMEGTDSFKGILQTDGYAPYAKLVGASNGRIQQLACTAHIRRGFTTAAEDHPALAQWVLERFAKLYRIEKELRQSKAPPEERKRRRRQGSCQTYQVIRKAVEILLKSPSILPKSPLGKALNYAHEQLPKLSAWLEDGQTEIDNNLIENDIRTTKLGLKNWLFFGSADSGRQSAILYTFVENVRRLNRSPQEYLEWVFERLLSIGEDATEQELEQLLPANWAKANPDGAKLRRAA